MYIKDEIVNDILKNANIVEVIEHFIPVIKKGSSYSAVCPFHADTHPSLNINPNKQIFKCFACGTGGNAFTFVQKFEHLSFVDSVKKVADIIGYKNLEYETPTYKDNSVTKYLDALNDIASLYHYMLATEAGSKAREYLLKRNIDEDMQEYFNLGYSLEDSSLMIKNIRAKGYNIDLLDQIGITSRESSSFSDRFHGRVLFPIHNEHGDVIGFSGRLIEKKSDEDAKYINSMASVVFDKSSTLYNLFKAKESSKQEGFCYVVEGFMDVFALYKIGIKSSVALMGTAFTENHAQVLKRMNVEIRLMLDGDHAGQTGMKKMIKPLEKFNVPFRVVDYKEHMEDPDELLNQYGEDELKRIAFNLIEPDDFLIKYHKGMVDLSSTKGIKEFLNELCPRINQLKTQLEKDALIKKLASTCDISPKAVMEFIPKEYYVKKEEKNNFPPKKEVVTMVKPKEKRFTQIEKHERLLIYYMLNHHDLLEDLMKNTSEYSHDTYGELIKMIMECYEHNESISLDDIVKKIQKDESLNQDEYVNALTEIFMQESYDPYDKDVALELMASVQEKVKSEREKEEKKNEATKRLQEHVKKRKEVNND